MHNKLLTMKKKKKFLTGGGLQPIMKQADNIAQNVANIGKMLSPGMNSIEDVSLRLKRGYDLGGALDVAATATKQVGEVVQSVNDVKDRAKQIDNEITGNIPQSFSASSTTDLLNKWSSYNPMSKTKWTDFTNKGSASSYFGDMLSMSSEGALKGSKLGAIGAIAGGVGGLASGFFNNLLAKNKAKKLSESANNKIAGYNNYALDMFNTEASQLDQRIMNKELADFTGWGFAKGGKLNRKHFGFGGDLMTNGGDFPLGFTLVGNGGTHEENPYEGVPMGVDQQGIPNVVEEDEVIYNDYVFSNRLKVPKAVRNKYKLKGTKPISFAKAALQFAKEIEERPNDPISRRGYNANMSRLIPEQEKIRMAKEERQFAKGGSLVHKHYNGDYLNSEDPYVDASLALVPDIVDRVPQPNILPIKPIDRPRLMDITTGLDISRPYATDKNRIRQIQIDRAKRVKELEREEAAKTLNQNMTRMAPIISQGVDYVKDLFGAQNRPEYRLGQSIREANNQIRDYSSRSAGQKMGYKPIDMWAAVNNLNAQMAAQRSALRNAGNRVGYTGNMLASAYNQNNALGALYAGMEDANFKRLTTAIAHNTQVDQADRAAEDAMVQLNAGQGARRAENLMKAAQADDAEESLYAQARNANKNRFFDSIGTLGKEQVNNKLMEALVKSGVLGTPNEEMKEALAYAYGLNLNAEGGKIVRKKKKKGLTYG